MSTLNISEYRTYLVLAGKGNDLAYHKVAGDSIGECFKHFDRVCEICEIECFECYTKNPETGETGWEIEYVETTREMLKHYPNFDCIITKGYPCGAIDVAQMFYSNDYGYIGEFKRTFQVGDKVKEIEWGGQFARGAKLEITEIDDDYNVLLSDGKVSLWSDASDVKLSRNK